MSATKAVFVRHVREAARAVELVSDLLFPKTRAIPTAAARPALPAPSRAKPPALNPVDASIPDADFEAEGTKP